VGEQKKVSQPEACAAPVAKFAITMQRQGKEQPTEFRSLHPRSRCWPLKRCREI